MKASSNRPNASEILRTVPPDKAFLFFEDIGKYTGKTALNLADFLKDIQAVPPHSVTFHFKRGDFDKWIQDILHDPTLAARIKRVKKSYAGKELRTRISKLVEKRLKELQPRSR
jgi:alpha-amylase